MHLPLLVVIEHVFRLEIGSCDEKENGDAKIGDNALFKNLMLPGYLDLGSKAYENSDGYNEPLVLEKVQNDSQ